MTSEAHILAHRRNAGKSTGSAQASCKTNPIAGPRLPRRYAARNDRGGRAGDCAKQSQFSWRGDGGHGHAHEADDDRLCETKPIAEARRPGAGGLPCETKPICRGERPARRKKSCEDARAAKRSLRYVPGVPLWNLTGHSGLYSAARHGKMDELHSRDRLVWG